MPRRPIGLHRRHDVRGSRGEARGVPYRSDGACRVQGLTDHRLDAVRAAEDLFGLGPPAGALLGEGAGFMLGLAGFQVRLLRQSEGFDGGRRPPVRGPELHGELVAALLDTAAASRPAGVQHGVDAVDLSHRTFSRLGDSVDELDAEAVGEVAFQGGVVVSDAVTFALNNTRPSIDNQRPSTVCTLFATAIWVWRSGSPALARASDPWSLELMRLSWVFRLRLGAGLGRGIREGGGRWW